MNLKLLSIAFPVLLLSGCLGTAPAKREPTVVYKEIAINCIKSAPVRPAYKTELLASDANDLAYADALIDDWLSSRTYELAMEAAVKACLIVGPVQ